MTMPTCETEWSQAPVEAGVSSTGNCRLHSLAEIGDGDAFVPEAQAHGCFKHFQHDPIKA